ncbi:MAG: DUF4091 domain-containing protein [candidate division WS1 bacterium]|nr:DUF4091 domain-containing protein [candidate division WS1 bacterium]
MRLQSSAMAIIVLLSATCCIASAQDGLAAVPNAGFEEGEGEAPVGWSYYAWDKEASRGWWDDEIAHTGARSVGMQGLNSGWSTTIPVTPGSICNLSLHYRAEDGPSKVVIYVRYPVGAREQTVGLYLPIVTLPHDQQGAFVEGVWVEGADERGWVHADAGDFKVPETEEQVSLLIKLASENPEARLWLDDIVVTERAQAEVTDTARVLARFNGGALWTDDENRKILPERDLPDATTDAVELTAARGEYESFQLAVTPETDMSTVSFAWSDLTGPATITTDALRCRRIEHVDIQQTTGPFGHQGLNPDPLTERLPVDIPASFNQGFWFTLQVPADQAPGDYSGELSLLSGEDVIASVPLRLRVHDFAIPPRPSMDVRSAFRYNLVLPREAGEPQDVIRRYYDNIYGHRSRCAPAVSVGVEVQGDTVELNIAQYIEHLVMMRDSYGVDRFDLPVLWISHKSDHMMPPDASWQGIPIFANEDLTELSADFTRPFSDYVTKLVAAYRDAGVFLSPMVRFIDEPRLADERTRNGIRAISELLLDIEPELRILHTVSAPHPDLMDITHSWILHTDAWEAALPQIMAARAEGDTVLVYNNAVNIVDHEPIRTRLWPWLLRKYGVDGTYSWWGTVCWRGQWEDPWTAGVGSSGVMLYPPRTPDEQGPIDSIRWELFREGLEDFEYMVMAEQLAERLEAAGNAEAAKVGRDALEAALSLVERWPSVRAANDQPYTLDVEAIDAAREQLAAAIVSMQGAE